MYQNIYFAKTREGATIPSKRPEDSGYDFYSCFEEDEIKLYPGDIKLIPTGIASAFSPNLVLFIKERSSTGAIGLSTRMGVIDSGFRGEIFIGINNTSNIPIIITKRLHQVLKENDLISFPYSKAIAQGVICVIPEAIAIEMEYDDLLKIKSQRGISFMGSSGK